MHTSLWHKWSSLSHGYYHCGVTSSSLLLLASTRRKAHTRRIKRKKHPESNSTFDIRQTIYDLPTLPRSSRAYIRATYHPQSRPNVRTAPHTSHLTLHTSYLYPHTPHDLFSFLRGIPAFSLFVRLPSLSYRNELPRATISSGRPEWSGDKLFHLSSPSSVSFPEKQSCIIR